MLAALRTLEVCKTNHMNASVPVLTKYLIWFFWSPNLQKYFWVFGKAFYCNIATASILKTLQVHHINYIRHVGFSIFDQPNFSPEQALPGCNILHLQCLYLPLESHHQYLLHQKASLRKQPPPRGRQPLCNPDTAELTPDNTYNPGRCSDDK